jgi:hypothetical protein
MGRGKARKSLDLIEAAKAILAEIQPATVRAVCYRLFVGGAIPSMGVEHVRRVSTQLVDARESGSIPWEWIVDTTRAPRRPSVFASPRSFAEAVKSCYHADPWQDQAVRVEIWSEKDTVSGVLAPVLQEYAVPFRVNRGFASATAVHDIAGESHESDIVALYVGDWDPSGLYMPETDLPGRLAEYGAHEDLRLCRVALVREDLDDLPSFDASTKANDTRYQWFVKRYGSKCWELDAMNPNDLRRRVASEIEKHIEPEAWERVQVVESAIRQSTQAVMDGWLSGIPALVRKYEAVR